MKQVVTIRVATETDAQAVAELVQGVGHYFWVNPSGQGAEGFLASISTAAMHGYINNLAFIYIMGFVGTELAGVAALKDKKHIYHLFVRPVFHRRGVASQLWQFLKAQAISAGNPGTFTVNSSLYAVPVYSSFGFLPTGQPQEKNGVQFQSMQLTAPI
jgi:GNAT superfamily N-acetyltransferase